MLPHVLECVPRVNIRLIQVRDVPHFPPKAKVFRDVEVPLGRVEDFFTRQKHESCALPKAAMSPEIITPC